MTQGQFFKSSFLSSRLVAIPRLKNPVCSINQLQLREEEDFGLVWFYGISTIVCYLMPNPFLNI